MAFMSVVLSNFIGLPPLALGSARDTRLCSLATLRDMPDSRTIARKARKINAASAHERSGSIRGDRPGLLNDQQVTPMASGGDAFEQLIKSDLDRWGNVIKSAGIRVE